MSSKSDLSNLDKSWLMDIVEKTGQARSTVNNWWSAFCRETGLSITPRQASDERKTFAAEVGRLLAKLRDSCNDNADCNLQTGWLLQIADKTSITPKTAYNWWSAFCRETGLSITPRQASDEHRNAFFAWLATAPNAKPLRRRWGGLVRSSRRSTGSQASTNRTLIGSRTGVINPDFRKIPLTTGGPLSAEKAQ